MQHKYDLTMSLSGLNTFLVGNGSDVLTLYMNSSCGGVIFRFLIIALNSNGARSQSLAQRSNVISVCNLSDHPTKVGFRIFCRISSDYEEYARSLSDFNIFDHITLKQS